MRFLLDMGISRSVEKSLVEKGHDVVHVRTLDPTATDPWIVGKALETGRIVVTADLDFGDVISSIQAAHPSIIILRLRHPEPALARNALLEALDAASEALSSGAVVIVEDGRHRIRHLPIARNDV